MLVGVLLGLAASASWAIANVAVQRSARQVGTFRALLWAQVLGALCIAAALPFETPGRPRLRLVPGSTSAWPPGSVAASLLAYVCLFYAFEHGRLTIAVPVMSSWAVIAAALSLVLFDQRLAAGQLAGAAAVIAGAVVVSRHAQQESASGGGAGQAGAPRWLLASVGGRGIWPAHSPPWPALSACWKRGRHRRRVRRRASCLGCRWRCVRVRLAPPGRPRLGPSCSPVSSRRRASPASRSRAATRRSRSSRRSRASRRPSPCSTPGPSSVTPARAVLLGAAARLCRRRDCWPF